jgi:restriction system protein
MALAMHKNSLFAVLLRSPWWISMAVAAGMFAVTRMLLPEAYAPYGIFTALPFLVIGSYAGWQQLRAPSAARIAARLDALRGMGWDSFAATLEEGFRRDGYGVARSSLPGVDLELTRAGRVTLVGCKRWKAARAGIEPLRELHAARQAHDAQDCIYVAAGEVSDTARAFAAQNSISLLEGGALALLLVEPKR